CSTKNSFSNGKSKNAENWQGTRSMPRIEHFGCKPRSVGKVNSSKSKKLHRPKSRAIRPMNSTALPNAISVGGSVKIKEAVQGDGFFFNGSMARGVWGWGPAFAFTDRSFFAP